MRQAEFAGLVHRAEQQARERPGPYRLRVALLAIAGYAYVWGVLLAVTAVVVGLIWMSVAGRVHAAVLKFIWVFGVLAWVIVRAMWVRFEPPAGVPARGRDAPELLRLVDRLRASVAAPRFHDVVLTHDFNAAVVQTPRLGPFGWYRNTLVLGIPLMQALSPDEFTAVLAHEVGHLSRAHGRFGSWIYRIRAMWGRLVTELHERKHWATRLFDAFLDAWAPYFNAYSFVLARAQEYEADRFAVAQAGAPALGRALAKLEVLGGHLTRDVWPAVHREVERVPAPPTGVFAQMGQALRAGPERSLAEQSFAQALAHPTGLDDTHPGLADRLRAIGVAADPGLAGAPHGESALARFFGERADACLAAVEARWHEAVADGWRRRHEEVQAQRARLRQLEAAAAMGTIDARDAWARAELTLELDGEAAAEPLLRDVLQLDPDHAAANFLVGRMLLARDDAAGLPLVERAMARDQAARDAGYAVIHAFLQRTGRAAEATAVEQRAWAHGDALTAARDERRDVTKRDEFLPHDVAPDVLATIVAQVATVTDVREAYLARKAVRHLPDLPFYVLGIRLHSPWYRLRRAGWKQAVAHQVVQVVPFPGDGYVLVLDEYTRPIARKMRRVSGARILAR